jgi:mRNA interferase RelE/StbE
MANIVYTKRALRSLTRIPVSDARRIVNTIEDYASDPQSHAATVRRLTGRPGLRLRVGDWRVIFERDGTTVTVLDIGPRGSIYG